MSLEGLAGRRALVTGGGQGIGFAIAERLAREGVTIALNDKDARRCAEAAQTLTEFGSTTFALPGDVGDAPEKLVGDAAEKLGGLDILVNNAAIESRAALAQHSLEMWESIIKVNLTAPFQLARAAVPLLLASRRGAIVNIASITVVGGSRTFAYDASKGGLQTLTRSLAVELGRVGVRVNAVCPGFIETPMTMNDELRRIGDAGVATLPIRRWGRAEEVAAAVAWLASDEASYVTGHSLFVDGGFARR